jgi:hypothetical protein
MLYVDILCTLDPAVLALLVSGRHGPVLGICRIGRKAHRRATRSGDTAERDGRHALRAAGVYG